MGRRRNNPDLVEELIEGRLTMDQDEFEEKYFSLSSSDMGKVSEAINGMVDEWMDDDMPEGCAACGNPAFPDCTSSCPMFDD